MSIKLHLVKGDAVRNINRQSTRFGWVGTVISVNHNHYVVEYGHPDRRQSYQKEQAHRFIEKLVSECRMEMYKLDFSRLEALAIADMLKKEGGQAIMQVHDEILYTPKRRTLKKVRRNVITGKTQDDMMREHGPARGAQQFNTRALGRSTGQALRIIGDAMCNPTTAIRLTSIDHAISDGSVSAPRNQLDKHFRELVKSLIGNMKGFTFDATHVTFNPIVTEETYVEMH